jgi:hypothetical protein
MKSYILPHCDHYLLQPAWLAKPHGWCSWSAEFVYVKQNPEGTSYHLGKQWADGWRRWQLAMSSLLPQKIKSRKWTNDSSTSRPLCSLLWLSGRPLIWTTCFSLSKFICLNPKPQWYGIRKWDLWELIRLWGWVHHDGISVLVRRDPRKLVFSLLSAMQEHGKEASFLCIPVRGPHCEPDCLALWSWTP